MGKARSKRKSNTNSQKKAAENKVVSIPSPVKEIKKDNVKKNKKAASTRVVKQQLKDLNTILKEPVTKRKHKRNYQEEYEESKEITKRVNEKYLRTIL